MLRTKLFRSQLTLKTPQDRLLSLPVKHVTRQTISRSAHRNVMEDDFADRAEELRSRITDEGSGGRGRGGRVRGRGRGGRRGGKAEGGAMSREVAISKALSKLLRHAAEEAGLKLDSEGYAHLDEVVSQLVLFLPICYRNGATHLLSCWCHVPRSSSLQRRYTLTNL